MSAALEGRVAIVTGAGKGLGRAYALDLARMGAAVIVVNRRHTGEGDEATSAMQTVRAIEAAGGRAAASFEDVSAVGAGARMVQQAISQFGRLDIVVDNAGVSKAVPFHKTTREAFREVFDPNFFGTLDLAMAAWPVLRAAKYGRVVLTASSAGYFGVHGLAAYSAAKAAVIGLMRVLALEGGSSNVKVNCILPYAYSQMTATHMDASTAAQFDPALVAPLVTWFAGAGCGLNGEVLIAGGGRIARAVAMQTSSKSLDLRDLPASLERLKHDPMQEFPTATAAFLDFLNGSGQPR